MITAIFFYLHIVWGFLLCSEYFCIGPPDDIFFSQVIHHPVHFHNSQVIFLIQHISTSQDHKLEIFLYSPALYKDWWSIHWKLFNNSSSHVSVKSLLWKNIALLLLQEIWADKKCWNWCTWFKQSNALTTPPFNSWNSDILFRMNAYLCKYFHDIQPYSLKEIILKCIYWTMDESNPISNHSNYVLPKIYRNLYWQNICVPK